MDEKFVTEFLRESNGIENVYDNDALDDALDAWEYLQSQTHLTQEVIQQTHKHLLKNRQPEIAGEYRSTHVRVGNDVPPGPSKVLPLMDELLMVSPDTAVEALDWHVQFEKVHPFADGNGRVGRLIYLWHCVTQLCVPPLMFREDDVKGYYALFQTAPSPSNRVFGNLTD